MRDGVKVLLKVGIQYVGMSCVERLPNGPDRLMGVLLRAKPVAALLEVRFKDRLNDDLHRHLGHSVANGRNSQWSFLSLHLGNVDPPHRLGTIGLFLKFLLKLREKLRFALSVLNQLES